MQVELTILNAIPNGSVIQRVMTPRRQYRDGHLRLYEISGATIRDAFSFFCAAHREML
jgi:hypothetical protein